jgi:hypothetical protein
LGLTKEVDNWLGESPQEDVDNSLFESDEIMDIYHVGYDDGKDGGGKGSEEREKVDP